MTHSRSRRIVVSDNLAFVPATLLPFRHEWQALALSLPAHSTLFVIPAAETPLKRAMRRLARSLSKRHYAITAVASEQFH